jgi:hypothetical protein
VLYAFLERSCVFAMTIDEWIDFFVGMINCYVMFQDQALLFATL